jgi:hypothetical protein
VGVEPRDCRTNINHVPTGIRAVYDLHQFWEEKRAALAQSHNLQASSIHQVTLQFWRKAEAGVGRP